MNPFTALSNLKGLLTTHPDRGALEITSASIKFLLIRGNRSIEQASVKLPPNTLQSGKIANTEAFVAALNNLHNQIAPVAAPLHIVAIVPSELVYAQPFSVPIMPPKEQEEAIDLNLQMISPMKAEEAYYDWQEIKQNKALSHIDLLGAFVSSKVINEYTTALATAHFLVTAIEFPGLSLSRLIKDRWQGIEQDKHYLMMYLNTEGLLMTILKNGNLYFNHFTKWNEVVKSNENKALAFSDIEAFIAQEMQRVLTFYLSRSAQSLQNLLLISPMFNYELVALAESKFKLTATNLTLSELPDITSSWMPVLGGALRSLIPRSKDTFISLAQTSAKTEYYQEQSLTLVALTRDVLIGMLILVFGAYLVVDGILMRTEESQKTAVGLTSVGIDAKEIEALRAQAAEFNTVVSLIESARSREQRWSPVLARVQQIAGNTITLQTIFADKSNLTVTISGIAPDEVGAIAFKNRLEQETNIKSVALPLSNIKPEGTNKVSFGITLVLKSL